MKKLLKLGHIREGEDVDLPVHQVRLQVVVELVYTQRVLVAISGTLLDKIWSLDQLNDGPIFAQLLYDGHISTLSLPNLQKNQENTELFYLKLRFHDQVSESD